MAKASVGIGPASVQRIWAKHGPRLKAPCFRGLGDPKLAEKR